MFVPDCIIRPILISIFIMLFGTGLLFSAELDDSSLFVEAFNAAHKKDYLLAIEKVNQLNQLFPDTPLRDVSLLLLARSGLKAGDNQLAAITVNRYLSEFVDNPLTAGVEDELLNLALRNKNGEKLKPDKKLSASARKIRNDQVALELAAAQKLEREKLAREQAERNRIAMEKAAAERKERERIAAEKAAKESIRLAISMPIENSSFQVDKDGSVPFNVVNKGTGKEEFNVSTQLSGEYAALIKSSDEDGKTVERIILAGGETFKGLITFRVPANKVDGHKIRIPLTVVSAKYGDVLFKQEKLVNASAPLVRAVVKPVRVKIASGEPFKYRITLLNAGSMPARDLTLRIIIPEQLELLEQKGNEYKRESERVVVFKVDALQAGELAEFNVGVSAGAPVADKTELRCQVEIINNQLKLKDVYASSLKIEHAK